jgi:hypothetical protein
MANRISTASGSERGLRKRLMPEITLATARGTDLSIVKQLDCQSIYYLAGS